MTEVIINDTFMPLATRMRPRKLSEFIGQQHLKEAL
jgi:replication-associated recombination protein RarA